MKELWRRGYARNSDKIKSRKRLYYKTNKDKVTESQKRYRAKNRETLNRKTREWCIANKEHIRLYREKNEDRLRASRRDWNLKNKEKRKIVNAKWMKDNADRAAEKAAKRRAIILQACPPWVDRKEIALIYKEARRITIETGIAHHVDHKHPLKHKAICGLHVPWNLQIIPAEINHQKKNRLLEEFV